MSSIIGGRSGNRGACAQPCRLPYTLYKDGQTVKRGAPLSLAATSDGFSASVTEAPLEPAKSGVFDKSRMEAQLKKLGDTPFTAEHIEIITEGTPFVSVSVLNGMRRVVCEEISEQICKSYRRTASEPRKKPKAEQRKSKNPKLCVQVRTRAQFEAANAIGADEIYVSYDLKEIESAKKALLVLPPVTKEGEALSFGKAERVLVQNIGQIYGASRKTLCGGERLNVTNSKTADVLKGLGLCRVTLSPELNLKELAQITKETDTAVEIIAYGRLPVMLVENCIIKSHYHCTKGKGFFELADRKNERFPLLCEGCRNVILNSVPLYMADKLQDILKLNPDAIRLMFTTESGAETKKVIAAYQAAMRGEIPTGVFDKITRGHFYRGVE